MMRWHKYLSRESISRFLSPFKKKLRPRLSTLTLSLSLYILTVQTIIKVFYPQRRRNWEKTVIFLCRDCFVRRFNDLLNSPFVNPSWCLFLSNKKHTIFSSHIFVDIKPPSSPSSRMKKAHQGFFYLPRKKKTFVDNTHNA